MQYEETMAGKSSSQAALKPANTQIRYEVTVEDLPLHCAMPGSA